MTRSKKDGRRGGAHRGHWWREWGSRRGPLGWKAPGPWTKWITHRMERRAAKRDLNTVSQSTPPSHG